jgi:beta-hydroxyacyl-ACP dehydratase FabZ
MALLECTDVMKSLPHRYPFLLVDRVLECDDEKTIVGLKNVTVNEPFFQGHFPGQPIMPGVLQLEAMAQTAGILLRRLDGNPDGIPMFMSIDKVKFRRPVVPGDQLRIEIEITKLRSKMARFDARCVVDGVVVSQAEMMCMVAAPEATA